MQLLHIDSSITGDNSFSRRLSRAVVDRLVAAHPTAQVTKRDLAGEPLAHLTLDALSDASDTTLDEFFAADTLVIGVPMYNFSIPSQLKAWIDRILIAGKTFKYTAEGPVGLAGGKRVILALSRGGYYGAGSAAAEAEHAERYLRTIFGFIGIHDVETVLAEGLAVNDDTRQAAMQQADAAVEALAA